MGDIGGPRGKVGEQGQLEMCSKFHINGKNVYELCMALEHLEF